MKTTTARSLEYLRKEGYEPDVVERYNSFSKRKNDLFGIFDILAIHKTTGDTLACQTTSGSNVSSRINKITLSPNLPLVRKAGWTVVVHGWQRGRNGRYTLRVEDLS